MLFRDRCACVCYVLRGCCFVLFSNVAYCSSEDVLLRTPIAYGPCRCSLFLSLSRGLCEPSSCEFKVVWSGLVASQGSEYSRYYVVSCVLAMAQTKL